MYIEESFDTIFNIGFGGRTTPPLPLLWVGKIAHGERVKNEVILHRFQAVIFKCFLILILMIRIKHPKKLNPINNEKYGSVPYIKKRTWSELKNEDSYLTFKNNHRPVLSLLKITFNFDFITHNLILMFNLCIVLFLLPNH